MYLAASEKKAKGTLLKVNNIFATLKKMHPDGLLTFKFEYLINQTDIIKHSATRVRVKILSEFSTIENNSQNISYNRNNIERMIQRDFTDRSSLFSQKGKKVLAEIDSDTTSFIDNEIIASIRNGSSLKDTKKSAKSNIKLINVNNIKKNDDEKPVLYQAISNGKASNAFDIKKINYNLLLKKSLDPSRVLGVTPKVVDTHRSVQGTSRNLNKNDYIDLLNELYEYYTYDSEQNKIEKSSNDLSNGDSLSVAGNEILDQVKIPVEMSFYLPDKESTSFQVLFELFNSSTGKIIDTIQKTLNVFEHIEIYNFILDAPIATVSHIDDYTSRIDITQMSSVANKVLIYKKEISLSLKKEDEYRLYLDLELSYNDSKQVIVDRNQSSPTLYRIIPAYNNNISSIFTNIVVSPSQVSYIKSTNITTEIIDEGFLLEARNLSPLITSIQFLKKNLSLFEKDFSPIEYPIFIDQDALQSDYASVYFSNPIENCIYQFSIKASYNDGHEETIDSDIIKYIKPESGKLEIGIENFSVLNNDIQFSISLNIEDSDLDMIKSLLEKQGILSYFDDEIKNQRGQLKNLLAYSVHRLNLTTGVREDLGIITDTRFSDLKARNTRTSVLPLQEGHRYKYIITGHIRSPETVFSSAKKTVKDDRTKKTYMFRPSKFFHPSTKDGNLPHDIIESKNSILENGIVGSTRTIDVTFGQTTSNIISASVSRFDINKNIIVWKAQNTFKVDHFLLLKEIHGIKTFVSAIHPHVANGSLKFLHKFQPEDMGQTKYLILPVLLDYTIGDIFETNSILIDEVV